MIENKFIEREREITISVCVQSSLHNVVDRNGAWTGERRRRELLAAGESKGMVCAREECGGEERDTREGREKIGWREKALCLIDAMHFVGHPQAMPPLTWSLVV